jgi:hypothetical protein
MLSANGMLALRDCTELPRTLGFHNRHEEFLAVFPRPSGSGVRGPKQIALDTFDQPASLHCQTDDVCPIYRPRCYGLRGPVAVISTAAK